MAKQTASHGRRWYVLHTYSGYEENVARNLRQRIELISDDGEPARVVSRYVRDHDSDLMAGLHLSLHAGGDIADTIQISD